MIAPRRWAPAGSGSSRMNALTTIGAMNSHGTYSRPNSRMSAKLRPVAGFQGVIPVGAIGLM